MSITPRQQSVLDYITKHVQIFHMPPTRHEIAVALGFSSDNAAVDHLKALERKGFITLHPKIARGIRVLPS